MLTSRIYISDKVFAGFSGLFILVSWAMAVWAYADLPPQIPTHFGFSGLADDWSTKTFWSVFMLPIIQLLMAGLLAWAYRHPQYSNIPSTVVIMALPEPERSFMFQLIRRMIVVVGLIVNVLMAQIMLGIVSVGFGVSDHLNSWIIIAFVIMLLFIVARYTFFAWHLARSAVAKVRSTQSTQDRPHLDP